MEGRWWRFDRYQVVDGCIKPAPDAKLEEYDPYRPPVRRRYPELVSLAGYIADWAELQSPTGTEGVDYDELPADARDALLDWVRCFGLLGLFQQSTYAAYVRQGGELLGGTLWYERRGAEWFAHDGGAPGLIEPGQALLRDDQGWRVLPLAALVNYYLPGVEPAELPLPNSEPFWRAYREPLFAFSHAVFEFSSPLAVVQDEAFEIEREMREYRSRPPREHQPPMMFNGKPSLRRSAPPKPLTPSEFRLAMDDAIATHRRNLARRRPEAIRALDALRASVSPILTYENDQWTERLAAPSLLAHLAAMACEDLKKGVYLRHCYLCGKLFTGTRPDKTFCSPKHQTLYWKQQKRQQEDYRLAELERQRQRYAERSGQVVRQYRSRKPTKPEGGEPNKQEDERRTP